MVVTKIEIAWRITMMTQWMLFECFEVNGAAMQASPNFI